jgi:hypothetical protein
MKTLLQFLLILFLATGTYAQVSYPRCNDFLPPPEPQTYTVPTSEGGTTATAFLEEYRPGRDKSLSGCTILLKAGTVFAIDIPLCMEQVNIVFEEGSGIRILRGQTLTLYNCALKSIDANEYWKGITREDESCKVEMNNCRINNAKTTVANLEQFGLHAIQLLNEN